MLRKYVEGGGRALFMIDYQKSPRLVELLASWGVKVDDDVVVDLSGIGQLFGGGPLAPLVAQYENHPISEGMGNVATLFPMTRSVEPGETPPAHWHDTKLFSTTAKSFATQELKVNDGELIRNPAKERQGPIPVGVAATYNVPNRIAAPRRADAEKKDGEKRRDQGGRRKRIRWTATRKKAASSFWALRGWRATTSLGVGGNLDLFLNTLNWLSSDEDLISIRPKQPDNTPLDVSARADAAYLAWHRVWLAADDHCGRHSRLVDTASVVAASPVIRRQRAGCSCLSVPGDRRSCPSLAAGLLAAQDAWPGFSAEKSGCWTRGVQSRVASNR